MAEPRENLQCPRYCMDPESVRPPAEGKTPSYMGYMYLFCCSTTHVALVQPSYVTVLSEHPADKPPHPKPSKQVFLFDSCDDLDCNPTCKIDLLPGTRDETDSLVVWGVVLATFTAAIVVFAAGECVFPSVSKAVPLAYVRVSARKLRAVRRRTLPATSHLQPTFLPTP